MQVAEAFIKSLQTYGKIQKLSDFLVRFHQKLIRCWSLWNRAPTTSLEVSTWKGLYEAGNLGGKWEIVNCIFKRACIIPLIIHNPSSCDGGWQQLQVLLRAELPLIKGFVMGFPCGSAMWTDWWPERSPCTVVTPRQVGMGSHEALKVKEAQQGATKWQKEFLSFQFSSSVHDNKKQSLV